MSRQEIVLEGITADSEDSSTNDVIAMEQEEIAVNDMLITYEPQSVSASHDEDVASEPVKRGAAAATVNELVTTIAPTSPTSDTEEPQLDALSQITCTLQGFETLRAEILSRLQTTNGMQCGDFTLVKENTIIYHLLESLELGIGELQASVVNICTAVEYEKYIQCILCIYCSTAAGAGAANDVINFYNVYKKILQNVFVILSTFIILINLA